MPLAPGVEDGVHRLVVGRGAAPRPGDGVDLVAQVTRLVGIGEFGAKVATQHLCPLVVQGKQQLLFTAEEVGGAGDLVEAQRRARVASGVAGGGFEDLLAPVEIGPAHGLGSPP